MIDLRHSEDDTHISFEPYSSIILQKVNEARGIKEKNAIFESVINDDRAKIINDLEGRITKLFPGNKGPKTATWEQTKQMAYELNAVGISVVFLPELDDVVCSDSLIKIGKIYRLADFKYCVTTNANTLAKELEHGFMQAGTIILKLVNMDAGLLKEAIDYLLRNEIPYGNIMLQNKYGKMVELTMKEIRTGIYRKKITGFL